MVMASAVETSVGHKEIYAAKTRMGRTSLAEAAARAAGMPVPPQAASAAQARTDTSTRQLTAVQTTMWSARIREATLSCVRQEILAVETSALRRVEHAAKTQQAVTSLVVQAASAAEMPVLPKAASAAITMVRSTQSPRPRSVPALPSHR